MTRRATLCGILGWLLLVACARPPTQQGQHDGGTNDAAAGYCGDQTVGPAEGCDDGNLLPGDGCAPNCTVEPGWVCVGEPSVCTSLCGNALVDTGEACDGPNLDGKTCTTVPGGYTGGTLACTGGCQLDTTGCVLASCGNAVVDPGEACDDGNSSNTDACMNNCQAAQCGDGYTWAGQEECDDGNSSNTDACLVGCVAASCGDGHVWAGQETCDDGNAISGDGCSATCQVEQLQVLHWATGQPAVWDETTLYFAGEPHAPAAPVVAAGNVDQRDHAYLFTASTYHVLSLPGHVWLESGPLNSRFPGVPGSSLILGWGVSWPADLASGVALVTNQAGVGIRSWSYSIDNATGVVTPDPANPGAPDWSTHPDPPPSTLAKAAYIDLANAHGWMVGDPFALCGLGGNTVGPNLGAFTMAGDIYKYEAGSCFLFYDHEPVSQFPPFTQPNAPAAADITAAFYSTAHGNRLYVVTQQ